MKQEPLSQQHHSINKVANIRSYESTRTENIAWCTAVVPMKT